MPRHDVDNGLVALRLIDELVRKLQQRDLLPLHDIEGIVATLASEADRNKFNQHSVAKDAANRALGWIIQH